MNRYSGKLRIISGEHKGRHIRFPPSGSLRPTPERIRETLFNWLRENIECSICLDLFAGSGALGLEALSRGAKNVVFVESNRKAAQALRQNTAKMNLANSLVICQNAISYLTACDQKFDIVFLDPPYQSDLLQKSIHALQQSTLIKTDGWIYLESALSSELLKIPENWHLYRSTRAGDAQAYLYKIANSSGNHETSPSQG